MTTPLEPLAVESKSPGSQDLRLWIMTAYIGADENIEILVIAPTAAQARSRMIQQYQERSLLVRPTSVFVAASTATDLAKCHTVQTDRTFGSVLECLQEAPLQDFPIHQGVVWVSLDG